MLQKIIRRSILLSIFGVAPVMAACPDDPLDTDGDGMPDCQEIDWGTDPYDADTDDDGLGDGVEIFVLHTEPHQSIYSSDSDGDGILDGTEAGLSTPQFPLYTDISAGNFIPDQDHGATITDPKNPDTDGDGMLDGAEDTNKDGRVDIGETDPNVADIFTLQGDCTKDTNIDVLDVACTIDKALGD